MWLKSPVNFGSTATTYCSTCHHQSLNCDNSASRSLGSKVDGFGSTLNQSPDEVNAPDVELSELKACVAAAAADAADSAACTMRNASSAPSIPGTAGAADAVGLPSATGLPAALIVNPWTES